MTTDAYLRQQDEREHAEMHPPEADPRLALNAHLTDILADVARVRMALNNDEQPACIDAEAVKSRLCDISNALDDLYNAIRGI